MDLEKSGVRVDVIEEDITRAIKRDSTHCAVAEAIKRTLPQAQGIDVDMQSIRFRIPEERRRFIYMTPRTIQAYIAAFDAGEDLAPFSFTLNHPIWTGPIGVWANVQNNSRVHGEEAAVEGDDDTVSGTALITITEKRPAAEGEQKTVVRAPSLPPYIRPNRARRYGGRELPMNRVTKVKEKVNA